MKKANRESFIRKIIHKISHLIFKFKSLSFAKHILFFYLFITVIGSLILFAPISQQTTKSVSYIDALFTAASAFSDTGLSTLTTATTWSIFGQAIIAVLILVGGIGWFALKIYFFNILLGRPISFSTRETLAGERGSSKVGNTRKIIKVSVTLLFIFIILATLVLSLYFFFVKPQPHPFIGINAYDYSNSPPLLVENPYHSVGISFRFGLFHAISGLNNAGFDIIGGGSLMPYYHRYGLQIIFIILFVIGGLGYPVLYDISMWVKSKFTKEIFKWSLFTKISMTAYVSIVVIGLSTTAIMEVPKHGGFWDNPAYGTNGDKTMALIFNTMSTRNAGFATVNMNDLSSNTLILYSIMMFIGSAPSSTAGGVRTTTIAISMLSIWSKIRGNHSIRAFNRRISPSTVARAHVVVTVAMLLVLVGSFILTTSLTSYGGNIDPNKTSFTEIIFETSSAFGTTGLSAGMTSNLSLISKLTLILIMFIGQLGVSSTLLVWDKKNNNTRKYDYIEENITIG